MTRDAAVLRDVAEGRFSLMPTAERHLVELAKKHGYNTYFQDFFTSSTRPEICLHQKLEGWFAKLGNIGTLKGKVPTGVTAGILHLLKHGNVAQLEALAKPCGGEKWFDDKVLVLEARKRMQKVLDKAYEAGKATEEEVLDGVVALSRAEMWMDEYDEYEACFERAKEEFVRLLGEDSAKAVYAAFYVVLVSDAWSYMLDEGVADLRRLWEMAKVSLPDEAVTYDVADDLGSQCFKKGKYEEAKELWLAALEGQRRVLGEEHKDTLDSLNNPGVHLTT